MADEHDPARVDHLEHAVEDIAGIAYRVTPGAVPPPQPVLHTAAAGVAKVVRKPIEPAQFFPLLAAHLAAR